MREFRVNKYITLKLKGKETFIYVKGEKFIQCKYLLLNIPVDKVSSFDEIESIDEAAELLDKSLEPELNSRQQLQRKDKIPPEVEFWGHCSNLQVWAEANYDTQLLHRNIAFPLLKKLTDLGDQVAKKVFKEEIARSIESGFKPVATFLTEEGYLDYLSDDYVEFIKKEGYLKHLFSHLEEGIKETIELHDTSKTNALIGNCYLKYLDSKVLHHLLEEPKINFIDRIIEEGNRNPSELGNWGYSFFEKIGETISHIIKRKLLNFIREGDLNRLHKYIEFTLLDNLKKEDLIYLLKDPDINLLDKILKALRSTDIDSMFFIGQELFSEKIIKYGKEILKEKIIEIIKRNDLDEFSQIIGLGLLELLDDYELKLLLNEPKINLLENYIKVFDHQEIYSKELYKYYIKSEFYPNDFFRKILTKFPLKFKKNFIGILKNCTKRDFLTIDNYELLELIPKKELKQLLNKT